MVFRRNDRMSVALWLAASIALGSRSMELPARTAADGRAPTSCEVPPPDCPGSAPRGAVWAGTSHCDVEFDGRVWSTCDYLLPGKP